MSTRSGIGYVCPDGKVKSVYCHFDGYPTGVGLMLHLYYNTKDKVEELINLGSLSYIAKRANPIGEHSFAKPEEDTTVAYHRDRGEDLSINFFENIDDFLKNASDYYGADYLYLFSDIDNCWHCYDAYDDNRTEIQIPA